MDYPIDLSGVEIGGVYIHEPGGFISNVAVCLTSFLLVYLIGRPENSFQKNWKLFILFIGLGAFGGSFTHGLPTYLGENLFFYVWAIKNSFVPVANYFASTDVLPKNKWIRPVLIIKATIVISALYLTGKFLPAVVDLGLTYLIVIFFAQRLSIQNKGYRFIRNAFIVGLLSGSLYIVKYDIDQLWFTHKDMVHVFVIISLIMIYIGVKKTGVRVPESKEYPA
jgi:hypothetical protein